MEQKKDWIFLTVVILIGLSILIKTVEFRSGDGSIKLVVSQQKGNISDIDTPRKISSKKIFHVRNISFEQSRMLKHKNLGEMGFSSNFFIDASVLMDVSSEGEYEFIITSDDGFRLKIDNNLMCEHPGNRPFSSNKCNIYLSKKEHKFLLTYWQGGGPLGLNVKFRKKGTSNYHFIGDDSKNITFKELK